MPAKLRQDMGEKFIVTKGLDGCLFAFSQNEWLNFETKLKALPLSDRNARNFVRFFLSGATECEIDKQGRFLIPSNLRTAAGLEKEAVIIGVGTRLEIWNKATWEKCDENIELKCNNNLPMPLTLKGDVVLYDENIYLLSNEDARNYRRIKNKTGWNLCRWNSSEEQGIAKKLQKEYHQTVC